MVLDASTDNENGDGDDGDDEESSDGHDNDLPAQSNSDEKLHGKLGRRLQISHLLKMVRKDAQTRLFFKAQSVVQSDIRHFVPKADDLAYPDVLVGMCFSF
jgi:conserved oligomeric Golgi complex subunit 3